MKNPILPDMSDVLHLMSDVFTQNVGQFVRHLSFFVVDNNVFYSHCCLRTDPKSKNQSFTAKHFARAISTPDTIAKLPV